MLGILRLDNLACSEKVCTRLFFLCCVNYISIYMSEDQVAEERDPDLNEEEDIRLGEIREWRDVSKEGDYKKKIHSLRWEV